MYTRQIVRNECCLNQMKSSYIQQKQNNDKTKLYHLPEQGLTPAARGLVVTPSMHARLTALQCIHQHYLLSTLLTIKFPIQMYRAVCLNRDRNSRQLNKMHD